MQAEVLLKAAATAADQGTFTAIISSATVDRDGDIVEPSAVLASLQKWAALGKRVPLLWDHTKNVVGHIDPATARIEGDCVVADGFVDQEAKGSGGENLGEQAWRLVKSGTLSFSFGFLFEPKKDAEKLAGGRYRVKNLDVYEVSVIPVAPANNDTRVLSFKSIQDDLLGFQRQLMEMTEDQLGVFREMMLMFQKAVWTASYINDLPDSSFLYIEDGGSKDADGRTTPRGLRHFPVKDASGNVDLPHLRNALSRIPQSSLPQDVKDRLAAKAQRMLADATKSVDVTDKEAKKPRSVDPLHQKARDLVMEFLTEGSKPPADVTPEPVVSDFTPDELKAHSRDLMVQVLTGV